MPGYQFNGVLATYNHPGSGHNETSTLGQISASTDKSKIEFPGSSSTAMLSGVDAGSGGVGSGRALKLEFSIPQQQAQFAGCLLAAPYAPCDCAPSPAYAYLSLAHQLVPDGSAAMDLSGFSTVSFWVKSSVAFNMKVQLSCQGEMRPFSTVAPGNGYMDSAFNIKNPCWYAGKSRMFPALYPLQVNGNSTWQRVTLPLNSFSDASVPGTSGAVLSCGLSQVREISFSFDRSTPLLAGEYPADSGTLYFDDLVFE